MHACYTWKKQLLYSPTPAEHNNGNINIYIKYYCHILLTTSIKTFIDSDMLMVIVKYELLPGLGR